MNVVLVPTGVANLASVRAAFERIGATTEVSSDPRAVRAADRLVLPGVGAFAAGMDALRSQGLVAPLCDRVAAGRPTLAICLGLQLLLHGSDESPGVEGLGVVPGTARRLAGTPVPQLGWNRVGVAEGDGILRSGWAYFANSYALHDSPEGWSVGVCHYGGPFAAALERGAVLACQFHPELSGRYGLDLLEQWLSGAAAAREAVAAEALPRQVRVIPCLDVRDGRVVKGVRFQGMRDAGDPAELASAYEGQGADELVMLDVSATPEGRRTAAETVRRIRKRLSIPLTVGGGVRGADDAQRLLEAGADKVGVNTAAVRRPELLSELATSFGRQCTILSIDAARAGHGWTVRVTSGKEDTGLDAVSWAREATALGAGEILLTSWDRDGTREGYDLDLLRAVTAAVEVPVIASGGASSPEHLRDAAQCGATGVLAASIFHYGEHTVDSAKRCLAAAGIGVRP